MPKNYITYLPIWYAYLYKEGGKLSDYSHLEELSCIEKIWQLLKTKEQSNIDLANQLAKRQGWTEADFWVYYEVMEFLDTFGSIW